MATFAHPVLNLDGNQAGTVDLLPEVFKLEEIPEMARGAGVILQRYKDGGLADIKVFPIAEGLTWKLGDRIRTETNLREWIGARGQTGHMPPAGFPRTPGFGG